MAIPVNLPKTSAWRVQQLVIYGLFLRECKTRFGRAKLGLFWALLQPLTTVLAIGVLLGYFLERTVPEIPYPMFLLIGFLPFGLFRGLITSSLTCFESNQGLLIHQKVRPTDPIFARVFYELMIFLMAFLIFVFVATWYFNAAPDFSNPLLLVAAGISVVFMGTGLGIFSAILSWRFEGVQKAAPLVIRPLLFLSCVHHPLHIVPSNYREYFLINPLVHVIESLRHSLYPNYRTDDGITVIYPLIFGVLVFWLGMAYYRVNRGMLYDFGR